MDQKFISGNFLPPPRGYPPIALLNNDHYPALRTSPLPFFQSGKPLKRPPLEFCSPFPHLNLVSSRAGRRNVGKGREKGEKGNTSFLHQSCPASSGAVLTGQHSRLLTDLPPAATPYSRQFPPSLQNIPLNFLPPINTFSCPRKRPRSPEKLKEPPSRDLAQLDPLSS